MKKLALVVAALAFSSVAAAAADLATKARSAAVVALPSWTGFYVGINGGGAFMSDPSMSYVDGAINAITPITVTGSSSANGIAGFHAGYNFQMPSSSWLVGIEGDWDWTNLKSSAAPGIICSNLFGMRAQCGGVSNLTDNAFLQTQVNWLASVRGRLGYATSQWLVYGTGGVAFADVQYTGNINCTGTPATLCPGGGQVLRSRASNTRVGFVVGAGAEFKPTRNWVVGAEYLYYRFDGDASSTGGYTTVATGAPAPFYECSVAGQNCGKFTYRGFDVQTVRARLSYQFD
ncbi:porin family protein [Bradyrhizobium diazoefficiens]|uniref:outer membrane protein n=1 Tax=Bradyrhizobium diazoefficiens TaxID=1355477 RepID=UPI0019090BC7|nr:outer membrane beta-barrel protein [Bradyrhizobium diazoefficiens]MBK3664773.1 porin family protein [Bradyrhizobium diazoefficiens]